MRHVVSIGPALVVLAAAGVALVATPLVVRKAHDARADAEIVRAERVLNERSVVGVEAPPDLRIDRDDDLAGAIPVLEQLNRAHRAIARLVEPSVVHVSTLMTMQRRNFAAPYASSGSGWIWDEDGHVVTNAHVVDGSGRLQVQLFDGELREAELVGLDLRSDIAVIKVAGDGLHPARRGDSGGLEQGDMVFAFGSPFDFRFSMSAGIVSGLGRTAGLADIDYENFIQTDAAINPGNSGGPLTDVRGRVIGMNTAIATGRGNSVGQGQFAGIGLAIPMSMIEPTVTQIIESGEVRKGYLGVRMLPLDEVRRLAVVGRAGEPLATIAREHKGDGVVIGEVTPDSPAEAAGFRDGDVVVAVGGQKVATNEAVSALISSGRPGERLAFDVFRYAEGRGERLALVATLTELDASVNLSPNLPPALERAGIRSFATATVERSQRLGVPFRRGVLLEDVDDGSELGSAVPDGSTITAVFDVPVGSIDEFYTRVNRAVDGRTRRFDVPVTIVVPDGRVVQVVIPVR